MSLADTLGAERLASQYFMVRLAAVRRAQQLSASEQFDLARSPLSDEELEDIVDKFRDTPAPRAGWGLAEGLNEILSREPKRIPVSDLQALQRNLVAQGYAPPDAQPNGIWDPTWYGAFRRWDRDNFEDQRAGRHWYSAPIESGLRAISNTLPSRIFQGVVGAAKGTVLQTPETFERGGLVGGGAVGAGIGAAAGSVIPGVGTAIGAGAGALIGGAVGFLADFFGEDEGEEDQSGFAKLVDALSPYEEYRANPKAIFEDLGYTLTAASLITGAGIATRGVTTGIRALQAARTGLPATTAAVPSGAAIANPLVEQVGLGGLGETIPLAKAALMRAPANNQLGVFGTVVRAATKRAGVRAGTVASLEQTMLKYSPIAFGQRLGPNIALKAFGGASQAQMGARLFGGLGQGSRERFDEAKAALEAELGRDLSMDEVRELEKKTAQTAIEKSIASAPELKTGVEIPFLGDLVDLAAFVLYPERLLPFRGAKVAKSATNLMGETLLAPYAHAIQHNNPGLGIRSAVAQVKAWLKPIDNAWLRADYGIDREAHIIIARAYRGNAEKAFRANALPNARADIIRTIRSEYQRHGKSTTLERIMRYSVDAVDGLDGPTDFTAWLVRLNGKHRGLDRLAAWKEANVIARKLERELKRAPVLADTDFALIPGQGFVRDGAAPGQLTAPKQIRRGVTEKAGTNVDRLVLKDRIELLERRAMLYERRADRGALDPFVSISLREQARLARAEAQTLRQQLDTLKAADKVKFVDNIVVTPARVEFADRAVLFEKRRQFLSLRQDVLRAVESGNTNGEAISRKALANFVDELALEGFIPDSLALQAQIGKPKDRIAKFLESQAQAAAKPVKLPKHLERYQAELDALGYKPVVTGDDVLYPDQLEQMIEVSGIGDYTRRAQLWETLGLSPQWRADRALFRLRREHEVAELNQLFKERGVKLSGEQALRRLHDRLREINHDGAVLGPFVRSEGKTRLYKVDVRDLSPDDVFRAFEDVPGVTDEVAHEIFGALRRGAAYGGELRLLRPVETVKALGKAMRLNGLPGFSDLVRTWHADVPTKLSRGALRRGEYTYKPPANVDAAFDLAHSTERARIEVALKQVAAKSHVAEGQRQFGMAMLDAMAQGQVRSGRFASVDDFFKHLNVEHAEKYAGEAPDALFKRLWPAPTLRQLESRLRKVGDIPGWYESSGRAIAEVFGGVPVTLRDGSTIDAADLVTQLIAVTSGGTKPNANFTFAMNDLGRWLSGQPVKGGRYGKNQVPLINAILDGDHMGVNPGRWQKYEPFRHALLGDPNAIVIDRRMKYLFGLDESITPAEQEWAEGIVRALSERTGLTPHVVQERLWVGFGDHFNDFAKKALRAGDAEQAAFFQKLADGVRLKDSNLSYADLLHNPEFRRYRERADDLAGQLREHFGGEMTIREFEDAGGLVMTPVALLRDEARLDTSVVARRTRGAAGETPVRSREYLDELRAKIDREGFNKDVMVEVAPNGKVMIIDGTHRLMLAEELGIQTVPTRWRVVGTEATQSSYDFLQREGLLPKAQGKAISVVAKKVEDEVLGMTQFGPDFRTVIRFFREADFETLVHENAHLLRRLVSPEDLTVLERAYGLTPTPRVAFRPATGEEFVAARAAVQKDRQHFLTPYTAEQIREGGFKAFLSEDGKVGYILKPDGEIANVFNVGGPRGAGREAVIEGIRQGGDRVEYFEGKLGEIYGGLGFKETERYPFDLDMIRGDFPDYDPTRLGEPEYVIAKLSKAARTKLLKGAKGPEVPDIVWTREAEEAFARDAERYLIGKVEPDHARGAFGVLRDAVGSMWGSTRPYWTETNAVPREVRRLFDQTFEDVLKRLPESRTVAALKAAGSKQVIGGAVAGGTLGALEGDEPSDILRGVALGAGAGLAGRAALKRTYGYLPDYLTRVNTALRYTLSFTFDAGRYTEQNMIAMTKHGLPAMLSPTKYVKAREWRSPFSNGRVRGDQAWRDAVRLYDEIQGTTWFANIDDLDRRLFQAGMLGFSPRNWEVAQAWQLYQRGMSAEKIREAVSQIGRYGLGRTAVEKSANFIVFPFSFSKKLITTLGDFMLQAPGRNLLLHEGMRRYHESEFDEKVNDFLQRRAPLLLQLAQINNLAYGISPGRFFLQGLGDQRTGVGKAMQVLASVFVPSGAATPLAQAAGGFGDLSVHAFSPIVLTGESITRGGGMDPITEIFRRYVPFIRELDQYFLNDNAAVRAQLTAIQEGAEPYYQFQKYQDELREAKAGYEGLGVALGYQGLDGLLQSNLGMGIQAELEQVKNELADKYPTGFQMSQTFENSTAIDERALLDLAERVADGRGSISDERLLELAEDVRRFEALNQFLTLPPDILDAMAAKSIRDKAVQWASDRRFAELYDRFFARTYGPIRRVA